MFVLRKWSVTGLLYPDKWEIHEASMLNRLTGQIFNNPRFTNGKNVITSPIAKVDGRKITTNSGSIYVLFGPPDDSFLSMLEQYDLPFDEANPIDFNLYSK